MKLRVSFLVLIFIFFQFARTVDFLSAAEIEVGNTSAVTAKTMTMTGEVTSLSLKSGELTIMLGNKRLDLVVESDSTKNALAKIKVGDLIRVDYIDMRNRLVVTSITKETNGTAKGSTGAGIRWSDDDGGSVSVKAGPTSASPQKPLSPRPPPSAKKASEKTEEPDSGRYSVMFGTNRRPAIRYSLKGDKTIQFTSERDERLHYGMVVVNVPKIRKFGTVGSNWFRRVWQGYDDRLTVDSILSLTEDKFFAVMRSQLENYPSKERSVLVYVHGFNVSFEAAAIRAAQMGVDLRVPGMTALFSWPSRGVLHAYTADEAAIEASEGYLTDFLIKVAQDSSADRVHLIAHSMGNRALIRAVTAASAQAAFTAGIKFGQIFLAAPDVDVFRSLAKVYPQISDRTTLYVSSKDRALEASDWVHDYARAGYTPPVTIIEGIDTVEVSNIDITRLGHGYFAEADAVLYDMSSLLYVNRPPNQRQRLIPGSQDGKRYWIINQ